MTEDNTVQTQPLFTPSHERCKEEWRCVVCGSTPRALRPLKGGRPQDVQCTSCGISYTLQIPADGKTTRYVPKCHYGVELRRVWVRSWKQTHSARATREWMLQFGTAEDANNAMNRLDGGIIH